MPIGAHPSDVKPASPRSTWLGPAWVEAALEWLPRPVAVFLGRRHAIAFANRRFRETFGFSADSLGQPALDVWPHAADTLLAHLDRTFRQDESVPEHRVSLHLPGDGRRGLAHFGVALSPVRDSDGVVIGVAAEFRELPAPPVDSPAAEEAPALTSLEAGRQARELRALLDNLTEAIVVAEPGGRVVRVNKAALKILGRPEAHARSLPVPEVYRLVINNPQGRPIPEHETPLMRAARGETFSEEDLWVTGLDGVRRRVAVSGGPVRDESGRILFGFNVFRDITDLRELERIERALAEETRAQREFLEGIFRAAPIGIAVVSEPGHIVEMANPIARTWAGMHDPLGLHVSRVYRDPLLLAAIERAVETLETQNLVDREVKAAGQESRFFSTTLLPLPDDGRTANRVLIVSWETTDTLRARQRAEQLAGLARQHSDELEAVIAQLPEGVVIADAPKGRIRLLNPAALSMAAWMRSGPEDAPVSLPVFEMLRPTGEPFGEDDPLRVALTKGRVAAGVEALLRQPEGRTLPVLVSAAPLRSPAGHVTGAVLTLRDITALKQIDRLKGEFLSMASHELKTPLTAVKGFSQLLLRRARKFPTDDRTRKALETIDEKVNYMSRLIEDLLDLSRVETDRLELRPVRTDLVALAGHTVAELQMITDQHQLSLETELDSLVGDWDEGRLEQVLINLVDNAIKYSPDGGPVTVRVERDESTAVVTVADRGIGIHPESQRRLFERFYRAHEDWMAIGGLGLGLYLSSEIIRRHGGQIGVESEPGKGSRFWFRIPITPLENHPAT